MSKPKNALGETDIWSEWLKYRRFGGDSTFQKLALQQVQKLSSKIIDKAEIFDSATVLDIGAGDGIVGLTALSLLGPQGKLILSDISEDALAIPKSIFSQVGNQDSRVEFLVSKVEDMHVVNDQTIDRIVMRAVLLYVENKQKAFEEIYRLLNNKGRAVLMEPINKRISEFGTELFRGYNMDIEPLLSIKPLLLKIIDASKQYNPSYLNNYDEHDLVHLAIKGGFEKIQLEYTLLRTTVAQHISWQAFFQSAPNPLAKSLQEIMLSILTKEEYNNVEKVLQELILKPSTRILPEAILILEK